MKNRMIITLCICLAVSVTACSQSENTNVLTTPQSRSISEEQDDIPNSETAMIENHALALSGMKGALTDDTIFGVKIYYNQPSDVDLSAETLETFKHEDASTYFYIVPRYADSSITLESMDFDESRNEFVPTGILFEAVCTDDYALLLQADLSEGGPKIRVTVNVNGKSASYEPTYDGRGDTVYPLIKNGVLLDEVPFSEGLVPTKDGNTQDNFETAIAQFDTNELVVDSVLIEPFQNIELLKSWVADFRQGNPGKVAVFMDGLAFPSHLYVFVYDGGKTYTITSYQSESDDGTQELPSAIEYKSSIIIERAYNYVFGADVSTDTKELPIIIHNRAAPLVKEIEWNPNTDILFGQLSLEQVEKVAKETGEHIYPHMTYYKVTGAIEIDNKPFYVIYGNESKELLERGDHSGLTVAVSGDGNLIFVRSKVDGIWRFHEDKDEKLIMQESGG